MNLNQALEHALNGEALLFVGAGFSRGATNSRNNPLKSGEGLGEHLCVLAGLPRDLPLDEASEEFIRARGKDELLAELRAEFTVSAVAAEHRTIAAVSWRRIYTTNYDDVVETASAGSGRDVRAVTLSNEIRSVPKDGTLCVHLNGFVHNLTRNNVTSEIKLTDTSYLTSQISDSPWAIQFRQDLAMAAAVFFVGYSLYDLDIRRILVEDPSLKRKCFFILGAVPENASARRASRFGTILALDTAGFAAELQNKQAHYAPPAHAGPLPFCVRPFDVRRTPVPITDRDVFDLVMLGAAKPQAMWASLHGGPPYFLEREVSRQITKQFRKRGRAAIVHSHLGNGKTLVLEGLKCRFIEMGAKVVSLVTRGDSLFPELEAVVRAADRTVIFIDDYPRWLDVIEYLDRQGGDHVDLILAARTVAHDITLDRLPKGIREGGLMEFQVDRLSPSDTGWLINLFDTYGLWGEQTTWSKKRKKEFIRDTCRSELHAVLLKLLQSPNIAQRLSVVIEEVRTRGDFHEIVTGALILTVLGHPPTTMVLADLLGEGVFRAEFRRNQAIRQLIDIEQGKVRLRSAVAAEFILRQIADPNATLHVLTKMARAADLGANATAQYRDLLRTLMRFSSVQDVLPDQHRNLAILQYYEAIKSLEGVRRQPLFWLQYAIACLFLGQFDRAEKYFQTAYALADAMPGYSTHQIDNHFARYTLTRAIRTGRAGDYMEAFRSARRVINDQIKRERIHYPYRVARLYREFYEAFEADFTPAQKEEVISAGAYVLRRIAELPDTMRRQRYIVDCNRDLKSFVPADQQVG